MHATQVLPYSKRPEAHDKHWSAAFEHVTQVASHAEHVVPLSHYLSMQLVHLVVSISQVLQFVSHEIQTPRDVASRLFRQCKLVFPSTS